MQLLPFLLCNKYRTREHNDTLKVPPEKMEHSGECRVLKVYEEAHRKRQTTQLGAFRLGTGTVPERAAHA